MERKFSEFRESDKSVLDEIDQFEDPASLMYLPGAVVASWTFTQEIAGSNPFSVLINSSVIEFRKLNENLLGKPDCHWIKKSYLPSPFQQLIFWNVLYLWIK